MANFIFLIGAILYGFFTMFFGFIAGKNKSDKDKAGILWINPGVEKDQYQFIFTAPLDDLPKKDKVWLEVQLAKKSGTLME